jgi:hypothetical protein
MLDRLFDCDRASLITKVIVSMIREFRLDLSRFHNDSTRSPSTVLTTRPLEASGAESPRRRSFTVSTRTTGRT